MPEETQPSPVSVPVEAVLSAVEARVLGCLMEKQRTTPDIYPLTLNALIQACNQKTSRNPVMNLDAGEVGHTLNVLRDRGLIHGSFAGRVERYDHKMASNFRLNRQEAALLAVLMLRGPQTVGELKINTGRIAEFVDLAAVEAALESLERRTPALVQRLARLPGKREERFGHLLCGELPQELLAPPAASPVAGRREDRIDTLEAEVARLRVEVDALWRLTGLSRPQEESL